MVCALAFGLASACSSDGISYKGVTKTGNVGGVAGGGVGVTPVGGDDGGGSTPLADAGDGGYVDAGLGEGFSCIPTGAYNGGCAPGYACDPLYQASTTVTYTCQSETSTECDGGCLANGQICDSSVSPNGGCLPGLNCTIDLSSGTYSTCQSTSGSDSGA